MNVRRLLRNPAIVLAVALSVLVTAPYGCSSNDFLGLEDYQRDLLLNGLAVALLLGNVSDPADDPGTAPLPGQQGPQGAQGPPGPPGPAGPDGADGAPGADGADGADGSDGLPGEIGPQGETGDEGPAGSTGATGSRGPTGATGPQGAEGAEFFDTYIDDFFGTDGSADEQLEVVAISIETPVLRRPMPEEDVVIGYRVAIPQGYDSSNDVTMRLFFYRTGEITNCFGFKIEARMLQLGKTYPQCMTGDPGDNCAEGTRWVRIDFDDSIVMDDGILLTVDLPLNNAPGTDGLCLDETGALQAGDMLAFELTPVPIDGRYDDGSYQILGAEFFEVPADAGVLEGAAVFKSEDAIFCEDCNDNGQADLLDIEDGTSQDCDEDGVPDECETDCNDNGTADDCEICSGPVAGPDGECFPDCNVNSTLDVCDIADGTSLDCDSNGVPDECQRDCNQNGIADTCDIASGESQDCNDNGTPDECDLCEGQPAGEALPCSLDCNENDVPDECDIGSGTSVDCNDNLTPDECENDCNENGIADECDIESGTSEDCDENDIPDECEICSQTNSDPNCSPDCNLDGIMDGCQLSQNDCNQDGVPDDCQIDCNENNVPDDCDIESGTSQDCNQNGVPDECDICPTEGVAEDGAECSNDCQPDGIPDECQLEENDCNNDMVPDDCQLDGNDCNDNQIPDDCDICRDDPIASVGGPLNTGGTVFLSGDDADDENHCWGTVDTPDPTACAGLYPQILNFAVENSRSPGSGILAVGVNATSVFGASLSLEALNLWNEVASGGPGATITHVRTPAEIASVNFSDYAVVYIPSVDLVEIGFPGVQTAGGITTTQLDALNLRQNDLVDFVNDMGGGLIALTQADAPNAYGWLPLEVGTKDEVNEYVCPTDELIDQFELDIICDDLTHQFYHTIFTAFPDFFDVLAATDDADEDPVLIGGVGITITGQVSLEPDSTESALFTRHTVKATVIESTSPFDPIPGVTVTFEIISGPNAGKTGTAVTDENGMATFSYLGDGGPGLDQIKATFVQDGGDVEESNVVTHLWKPCSMDCNGNNIPDECDLESGVLHDENQDDVPDECQCLTDDDCEPGQVCDPVDGCIEPQ